MPRNWKPSSAGAPAKPSIRASPRRCSGTWTTPTGGGPCAARSMAVNGWESWDERYYPRRRVRIAAVSDDHRHVQADDADLRQADDLLSAVDPDDRRHPRHPDHLDALRFAALPEAARRRQPMGHFPGLCRPAQARWPGPGLSYRRRIRRRPAVVPDPGRQHLL